MTWNKTLGQKSRQTVDRNRNELVDGGWGWVVAFASCVGLLISCSFFNINGIFYTYMIEEIQFELTQLTFIGSVNLAIALIGAVFVVPLTERFGLRRVLMVGGLLQFFGCFVSSFVSLFPLLFVLLGVVLGSGTALTYVTFILAVDKYFDKKKSIAVPLATCGASLTTVLTPVVEFLLERYGFHGAMMIYSAIMLNTVVCAAVVFPLQNEQSQAGTKRQTNNKESPIDTGSSRNIPFWRSPAFLAYLFANFLYVAAQFIPYGLLPETAFAKGVSREDISFTFLLSGITRIIGRLLFGFFAHRHPGNIKQFWSANLFVFGLTMIIVPFSNTFLHYLLFNMLCGVFDGSTNLGFNLSLRNVVIQKHYDRAISLALLMQGFGGLVGNPLAAFLQDIIGDGAAPYFFASAMFILGSLVLLPFSNIQETTNEIEVVVIEIQKQLDKKYTKQHENNNNMVDLTSFHI